MTHRESSTVGGLLDRLLTIAERVSVISVWIGGVLLFASAFIIAAEVVLRKAFGVSMGGADELSSYAFAISVSWAFSFALLHRSHIRVDALYAHLPRRIAALLDLLSLALLGVFIGTLTWFALHVFQTSWELDSTANTSLATPLWIPQGLWVLGLAVFLFTITVLGTRAVSAFVAGDDAMVRRIAGPRTIDEDIQDEMTDAIEEELERESARQSLSGTGEAESPRAGSGR